ncbi:MAG TPA: septum site-determining protein MinC [Firmicutes bacterium]|nr:septum site-determining protein MinC [Bacillota bacterium]
MSARGSVVLKGSRNNGVTIVIRDDADFNDVIAELRAKLGQARRFMGGAPLHLDTGTRPVTTEEFLALNKVAQEFGLIILENEGVRSMPAKSAEDPGVTSAHQFAGSRSGSYDAARQGGTKEEESNTLLHKRTLRSGQRIDYDGNVVVLGDVNPGAVINCTGDILVFGTLRGVAHAGAQGNAKAVVVAFRLEPTQLRIAQYISRAPDGETAAPTGPEMALVKDDQIQIEVYAC